MILPAIIPLTLAALFAALMLAVRGHGPVVLLDGLVQASLAPLRSKLIVAAFDWLTQMGSGAAGVAVLGGATGILLSGGRPNVVGPMWLAFIGAEATSWSLKFVAGRARPPFIEGLTAASPSFPSAHATVSIAVYGFLALVTAAGLPARRTEILAIATLLIALIAFSRLLLSYHYLSDIIGGALVGGAWLAIAWPLVGDD